MDDFKTALTAFGTSIIRATHTRIDPNPVFTDPWGDKLVPVEVLEVFRQRSVDRLRALGTGYVEKPDADCYAVLDISVRLNPMFPEIVLRSRYTEDALCAAVSSGIKQYVLVGAGFDSFVLRRPEFARDLTVIEVDQAKTQQLKLERITKCGLTPSMPAYFVAANFNEEDLVTALARTPFKSGERAFFHGLA
jgi:methyltransferase (TIGR00027 family)